MEKKEVLYRLRFLWAADGTLEQAETVHKTAVIEGGKVIATAEDRVTTVTPAKMSAAAQAALDAFVLALASDEAEAKAKKEAEEAAAAKAAAAKEAERLAAEEAAKEKA
jgi:hypothetical protein